MDEKIKLYESLLNEKASLEKKCERYLMKYVNEFGEDIQNIFELKIEAITLKKRLNFCVKKYYNNETIYSDELNNFIDNEILAYQNELEDLIEYRKNIKNIEFHTISFEEHKKIKKLYYKIVHLIHPDLHPEYKDDEDISLLWNKTVDAYKDNNYALLVEAYDQIIILISEDKEIYIENIDEKIEKINNDIEEIKKYEPYTYKYILENDVEIEEIHDKFSKDINDYKEYIVSLDKELSKFNIVDRKGA